VVEHCGYKHSRLLLRRLPTEGAHVLQGPGENAGVIDGGDGLALAFKVESHNHPSAIEPFQGAATGVGGILRDIFAMGARPIAILDSLRFGDPSSAHARRLLDGAVRGIGSLRQLRRRRERRRRGRVRARLRAELPRQRHVRGRPARDAGADGARRRAGQPSSCCSARARAATASAARRCSPRRTRPGRRREAPQRADRRSLHGQEA
jgi:hypothetical protein